MATKRRAKPSRCCRDCWSRHNGSTFNGRHRADLLSLYQNAQPPGRSIPENPCKPSAPREAWCLAGSSDENAGRIDNSDSRLNRASANEIESGRPMRPTCIVRAQSDNSRNEILKTRENNTCVEEGFIVVWLFRRGTAELLCPANHLCSIFGLPSVDAARRISLDAQSHEITSYAF